MYQLKLVDNYIHKSIVGPLFYPLPFFFTTGLTDKKEDSESESSLFDEEEQDDEDMYSESQFIVHNKVCQVARCYQ